MLMPLEKLQHFRSYNSESWPSHGLRGHRRSCPLSLPCFPHLQNGKADKVSDTTEGLTAQIFFYMLCNNPTREMSLLAPVYG